MFVHTDGKWAQISVLELHVHKNTKIIANKYTRVKLDLCSFLVPFLASSKLNSFGACHIFNLRIEALILKRKEK